MKKTLFIAAALTAFFAVESKAQVNDVSVTVSPLAGYTWWDNNSAIEDGVSYGARLGFGFGQNVELRAVYQKSADLKSTVEKLIDDKKITDKFKSRSVAVTRWGGEFKGNIPTSGWFAPYVTLGTGVQTLEAGKIKEEQIYADFGLGTKFNLSDRVVLTLEGKGSAFNLNPGNALRSSGGAQTEVDKWVDKNVSENAMLNWSALAGVQFYLGGRNPEEMTSLDYAYKRKFSSGLKGFKFILEPVLSYVDFDKKTNLKDTYMLGANLGFDFTDFVGVRGYYYRATKNEEISTDFDKLAMYGGDFIARLNVARGVVPYITVGGGYMNVFSDYKGANKIAGGDSGYFAKGGLGLNVPLGDYIEVFGAANMLLTTSSDIDKATKLQTPDELRKNVMYNAGLRVKLGAKDKVENHLDTYTEETHDGKDARIAELEQELRKAYANQNAEKAICLVREKDKLERKYRGESLVRLSPSELESLVNEVLEGVDEQAKPNTTEARIDRLERLLLELNTNNAGYNRVQYQPQYQPQYQQPQYQNQEQLRNNNSNDNLNQEILRELKSLNDQMRLNNASNKDNANQTTVVKKEVRKETVVDATAAPVKEEEAKAKEERPAALTYQGVSTFLGVNFGDATAAALGLKAHYKFTNSIVEFVPDVMIGLADKTAYAFNANIHVPFAVNKGVIAEPYIGTGLSLNNFDGNFRFGPNIILGTTLNVLDGKLYVDYTSRNLFKNNQVAVGYKFSF